MPLNLLDELEQALQTAQAITCLQQSGNKMFVLANIRLTTSSPLPTQKKFIRFQLDPTTLKRMPFPARQLNPHELQWDTDLTLPDKLYCRPLRFEIYQRHEFGFNPQEMDSILHGSVQIERDGEYLQFEVRQGEKNEVVGYLSCRVKHKEQKKEEKVVARLAVGQLLMVQSIVAHVPSAINIQVYFTLTVDKKVVKTSCNKSLSGDFVFIDQIKMKKNDLQTQGILTLWQKKEDGGQLKLAEGSMRLEGAKPPKKVILLSETQQLKGQAFVDCTQLLLEDCSPQMKSNSLPSTLHKVLPSKMQQTGISAAFHFKKISVVSPNQSICFPKEKRFTDFTTESLTSTRRSKAPMSLRRTNRPITKASALPGVGEYHLPTIWDRY